ncbi:MAG: LysM peptidoglycan-binding domain-containing protein [Anaerolineales bacterium]|nr:LysM peptidoglycan-binding domain-containing protein [Anaerolineales bacterium]
MSNKQRGLLIVFIFLISTMLLSACTQSLSKAPAKTPTLLPTGLFVSPIPSAENPMAMIEEFAKQTAAAQTSVPVIGTPGTPQAVTTPNGTVVTLDPALVTPGTPTNAVPTTPEISTPNGVNPTSVPVGVRPASYTLQEGEFPYCIARRFDVDPDALLRASGLTRPDLYYPGLVLKIPQSGAFPGDRALAAHPTTYTVLSASETLYGIACKYGDVDPASIASTNGISVSAKLSAGQQIKIP